MISFYILISFLIGLLVIEVCNLEYEIPLWNSILLSIAFMIGWPIILIGIDVALAIRLVKSIKKEETENTDIDNSTNDNSKR